jgi:hypothetical protein
MLGLDGLGEQISAERMLDRIQLDFLPLEILQSQE